MSQGPVRKAFFWEELIGKLYEGRHRNSSFISIFFPAALMVLIALLITLFAAITYVTTSETLEKSEGNRSYCTNYYSAETVATEILADFTENSKQQIIISNNRSRYESELGNILVFNTGNGISFTVPINKKESLAVMAKLTDGQIELIQWTIKEE